MTRLPLAVLALLLAVLPAAGQQTLVDRTYDPKTGTRCTVKVLVSTLPTSGYAPVRVTLRNGTKIDRSWSFRFRSFDIGWDDENSELRSSFSASCKAGQATSYEFLVPLVTTFQESFASTTELEVDVSATALPSATGGMSTFYDSTWPSIMMSTSLFRSNASRLDTDAQSYLSRSSSSRGSGSSVRFAGQFDPKQLSDQWMAYSGYDHCFLTDKEWRDLTPGVRSALLQWNRLGGSLLICTNDAGLTLRALDIKTSEQGARESTRSWGLAQLVALDSSGDLDPKEAVNLAVTLIPSKRGNNKLQALDEEFTSGWPLHDAFGSKTAHMVFFILVLVAFGVLVGPVNLFVFAKSGQRHRLFITTPIISIGASLLLILLIVFQDGFGGRGQRQILMEVRSDNEENAAYIVQEQIARTGVLFSTGFSIKEPVNISPVLIPTSRWARMTTANQGGNNRFQSDVLEGGLDLAGDWFQSRSEHGHLIETVRPTRGRLELSTAGGNPQVTSTFDFPLEELYLIDDKGDVWRANDVQQGRKSPLIVSNKTEFRNYINGLALRFTARNTKRLQATSSRYGHFVAVSKEVDGIETLDSISWKDTHAVITGPMLTP